MWETRGGMERPMAVTMDCLRGGGKVSVHFLAMVAAQWLLGFLHRLLGIFLLQASSPWGNVQSNDGHGGQRAAVLDGLCCSY